MTNNELTFNDLPQVVAELRDEVSGMKALLLNLQNRPTQQRENRHCPVTPEQVAEYTNIPLATIYQKLANREIPGSKPGKRWVIYLDEIDKWLEANRKNPIPLTDEEQNAAILASHKRMPNKSSWNDEGLARRSQPTMAIPILMASIATSDSLEGLRSATCTAQPSQGKFADAGRKADRNGLLSPEGNFGVQSPDILEGLFEKSFCSTKQVSLLLHS